MIKEPKSLYNDRCKPPVPLLLLFPFSCFFPQNALFLPLFCKTTRKTANFRKLFFRNIWRVWKNAVPLHPLFRTKHTPRKGERWRQAIFEEIYIRQRVVQEADASWSFWPGRIRVKKKSRPIFWNRCFEPNLRYIWMSVLENRDKVFPFS